MNNRTLSKCRKWTQTKLEKNFLFVCLFLTPESEDSEVPRVPVFSKGVELFTLSAKKVKDHSFEFFNVRASIQTFWHIKTLQMPTQTPTNPSQEITVTITLY